MKKFLRITAMVMALLCSLVVFCSCDIDEFNIPNGFDDQTEEQSSKENTEQTSDKDDANTKEDQSQTSFEKKVDDVRLSSSGVLTIYFAKDSSGQRVGKALPHVKKVSVKIASSQALKELDTKSIKDVQSISTTDHFDYIYVVFENGYKLTDENRETIKEFGIVHYGFG